MCWAINMGSCVPKIQKRISVNLIINEVNRPAEIKDKRYYRKKIEILKINKVPSLHLDENKKYLHRRNRPTPNC